MKNFLSIALAGAFMALNAPASSAGNPAASGSTDFGSPWPAPLTFRSATSTRTSQGLYNTLPVADRTGNLPSAPLRSPERVVSRTLNLCGSLLYSNTWTDEAGYGVYSVPSNSRQSFNCLYATPLMVHSYWDDKNGTAYVVAEESWGTFSFFTMYLFDTATGERLETINLDNSDLVFTDLAEDPTTGEVYGCGINASTNTFYWRKVDFVTQKIENITRLPGQLIGVGCDANGQFYAMGTNTTLYKVEKTTGELTELFKTNIPAQYNVGGCFNDDNNTFLQTSCTNDFGRLYEVDMTTGQTTMLYEFPDNAEVTNLHFQTTLANLKAPDAGEMMILPSDDGSLSVEALLTMPETLFDGSDIAPGTLLTYYIDVDGVNAIKGQAGAGEDLAVAVDVPSSGNHTFAFYTENGEGKSPKVYDSGYVGSAAPVAPVSAQLSWEDGVATLSWEGVSEAATEGFFDAAQVKYVVSDAAGVKVAGPLDALTLTLNAPVPEKFTILKYSVAAVMNDASSEPTPTNGIILGAMETPCEIDAREKDFFDSFRIVDANNDGCSWIFDGYNTGYTNIDVPADQKQGADDWLITNGIYLKAGHYYEVKSVFTTSSWMGANETVDIMCGASQTPEAMTVAINPSAIVTGFSTIEGNLSVPADGVYYIGYHVTSDKDQEGLSLQWVNIGEGVSFTAPEAPSIISANPDVDGDPKATVTFTFPAKDMQGEEISGALKTVIYADGELVKEVSGSPSEKVTADVTVPNTGQTTLELKTVNEAGEASKAASVKVNIGPRKPATPSSVSAYQVEDGKIRISWTPVTLGTDNKPIKEEYMTYNIHFATGGYVGDLIESGVTGDHYIFDSGITTGQDFFQFVVVPSNRGVTGTGKGTYQTPAGIPYALPFSLSHQDNLRDYIVAESAKDTEIGFVPDQANIASADGDGQFIGMVFDKYTTPNATYGRIYTGLVKLIGVNPTLSFYVFKFGNDDDNFATCGVIVDGVYTQLMKVNNSSLPNIGWNKVSVSLDNYGGKLAQIDFRGYYNGSSDYKLYAFDAVKVTNVQRYDLEASVKAPESVETGKPFSITASVANVGSKDAGSYTLGLYRGGELVKSVKGSSLAPDATNSFTVTETLGVTNPRKVEYKAVVTYEMDRNNDNDTATATVDRRPSTLPGIETLTGVRTEEGEALLTWQPLETTPEQLALLKGYNVYADGVKVNAAPVQGNSYTHASTATCDYQVSAVYENGESELSDPVTVRSSGVDSVYAGEVKISVEESRIVVSGAGDAPVAVMTAEGVVICSGIGDISVAVNPGLHLVTVADRTFKLLAR